MKDRTDFWMHWLIILVLSLLVGAHVAGLFIIRYELNGAVRQSISNQDMNFKAVLESTDLIRTQFLPIREEQLRILERLSKLEEAIAQRNIAIQK